MLVPSLVLSCLVQQPQHAKQQELTSRMHCPRCLPELYLQQFRQESLTLNPGLLLSLLLTTHET